MVYVGEAGCLWVSLAGCMVKAPNLGLPLWANFFESARFAEDSGALLLAAGFWSDVGSSITKGP